MPSHLPLHSPSYLKGRDSILYTACKDLGLHVRTTFFYKHHNITMLCDDIKTETLPCDTLNYEDESLVNYMSSDGLFLSDRYEKNQDRPPIEWITKPTDLNLIEKTFIIYGNQEALDYCYGYGCLVVEIGNPGQRFVELQETVV